jgi:3-oxoacyl-[acyl-carrier protein] reductase
LTLTAKSPHKRCYSICTELSSKHTNQRNHEHQETCRQNRSRHGASKGIGAAIAKHLAAEGAAVVVNYSSSKDGAERVVGEITGSGGRAIAVKASVAKKKDIDQLFAETQKAFGPIDILVNNAGIYEFSPVEDITEEHFRKQFDLNVLGLTLATQAAVKQFNHNSTQPT